MSLFSTNMVISETNIFTAFCERYSANMLQNHNDALWEETSSVCWRHCLFRCCRVFR